MVNVVVAAACVCVALVAWRRRPRRLRVVLGFGTVAFLLLAHALSLVGVLALTAVVGLALGWYRWTHTRSKVRRWSAGRRRREGVASTWQIARYGSGLAMLRRARVVRPSLRSLPLRQLLRLPAAQVGVQLMRAGALTVWASVEDVVLTFGGPRTGKSGWLGKRVLDAPGAVLSTSTRTDLYELTRAARSQLGPVHVFNPTGMAGLASTISFDPVSGCQDPVIAMERAEDMIPMGSGGSDRDHWSEQARRALAGLLYAAAIGGHDMAQIGYWIAHQDTREKVDGQVRRVVVEEIEALLADGDPLMADQVSGFLRTNERTRTSITSSMSRALAWLAIPTARAAASGSQRFDVAQLLRDKATIYLLGAETGSTASLVAALTGHIAREARRISATMPSGRLDPPLRIVLDEANLICPIPLASWTADMGGRGVNIIAAFQSRAQLLSKWDNSYAAEIINNAGAIMLYGGTSDRDDLVYWSDVMGHRDEHLDEDRTTSVPIFPPAQLRSLPEKQAIVLRRYMGPVIGRPGRAWDRRLFSRPSPHAVPQAVPAPAHQHPSTTPALAASSVQSIQPRRPVPARPAPISASDR
jgi:type IV secretion system protein VirD4